MRTVRGLAADLDRCIGCFACEVACKQEHDLPEGVKGLDVITLGPVEREGEPAMDFIPVATEHCNLCPERMATGSRPFCAAICPTQALGLYTDGGLLNLIRGGRRIHVCKIVR